MIKRQLNQLIERGKTFKFVIEKKYIGYDDFWNRPKYSHSYSNPDGYNDWKAEVSQFYEMYRLFKSSEIERLLRDKGSLELVLSNLKALKKHSVWLHIQPILGWFVWILKEIADRIKFFPCN